MTTSHSTARPRSWIRHPATLAIGLPSLLVLLYLLLLANPTYEATATLIVRESRSETAGSGLLAGLLNPAAQASREDAFILADYLSGAAFINKADAELGLRAHYATPKLDVFRRLSANASDDDFHQYFRKKLRVVISPDSGISQIVVKSFDPDMSRRMAEFVIAESENAINRLNQRLSQARIAFAEKELQVARDHLTTARQRLVDFQFANNVADPANEFGGRIGSLAKLDARIVEKRAELKVKQAYLREDAFELRTLRQEIEALEAQRDIETGALLQNGDQSMASIATAYVEVQSQAEFALQTYTAAITLAEQAKLQSARQDKFLLIISPPSTPTDPTFPRLFWNTLTTAVLAGALYGVARLSLATIRDHTL